jgi:hypothetical protein
MRYWKKSELRALWDRYRKGERVDELAAEYCVEGKTLRRHWKVHLGLAGGKGGPIHLSQRRDVEVRNRQSYAMREQGICFLAIAESFGVREETLYLAFKRYLKRMGLKDPMPNKSGRATYRSREGMVTDG